MILAVAIAALTGVLAHFVYLVLCVAIAAFAGMLAHFVYLIISCCLGDLNCRSSGLCVLGGCLYLYGFAASLKIAAFVPKRASADRGRRGKEISELRNKRFDQLCNKLRRVAEYYQRINIAESFEPICQKTDNKKQQS